MKPNGIEELKILKILKGSGWPLEMSNKINEIIEYLNALQEKPAPEKEEMETYHEKSLRNGKCPCSQCIIERMPAPEKEEKEHYIARLNEVIDHINSLQEKPAPEKEEKEECKIRDTYIYDGRVYCRGCGNFRGYPTEMFPHPLNQ